MNFLVGKVRDPVTPNSLNSGVCLTSRYGTLYEFEVYSILLNEGSLHILRYVLYRLIKGSP